jgi:hypothetical protein
VIVLPQVSVCALAGPAVTSVSPATTTPAAPAAALARANRAVINTMISPSGMVDR